MEFLSAQEIAKKWGISKRRVQTLCAANRIENAVRIGNMWVVPSTATKPEDARHRGKIDEESKTRKINPIKIARSRIKALSADALKTISFSGYSTLEGKIATVVLFATELLYYHINSELKNCEDYHEAAYTAICSILGQTHKIQEDIKEKISADFRQFIHDFPFCSDDALAWCYQYMNKECKETGFESTQFFTEKYMITTLIDAIDISSTTEKILDPACGGGNFLLYCLDTLADNIIIENDTTGNVRAKIGNIISRLYGYEIDPTLAAVASINLRLKVLNILSTHGIIIEVADFLSFEPYIYFSVINSKLGAIDCDKANHKVIKVGTNQQRTMEDVFSSTGYLFTNPPFQTVKGMDKGLKEYLKDNYPDAKCDMCNAFIQLSLELLNPLGFGGLVTQNSWLYLDSFVGFRARLLSDCTIQSVIEIGANAFYDLSGEKSNIALLLLRKEIPSIETKLTTYSLKTLLQPVIEQLLSANSDIEKYKKVTLQKEILFGNSSRFDMTSSTHLNNILQKSAPYGDYAIPMQGTSTGNAKELLDYYWQHINDNDWKPVSKGGGYSRWQGLNNYCVKWGKNGEFIKATKGSAIRNATHFNDTQLVFSDTGTSGLNVRILQQGQLFVASGPGIRVIRGDPFAHMAFLNSRFASYFIRLLSPKLTIAAGYISKLPIIEELLFSSILSSNAKKCVISKKRRLEKRPNNLEFQLPQFKSKPRSIFDYSYAWFIEDISDEWIQLCCEHAIENEICRVFELDEQDLKVINAQIGTKWVFTKQNEIFSFDMLEKVLPNLLDTNCLLSRTRADKTFLGCDGLIEYLSQKLKCSCEVVYKRIQQPDFFSSIIKNRYQGLFLHALALSILGFRMNKEVIKKSFTIEETVEKMNQFYPIIDNEALTIATWLRESFNEVHVSAFMNKPIHKYNHKTDCIESVIGENK